MSVGSKIANATKSIFSYVGKGLISSPAQNIYTGIASNILWNIYGKPDVLLGVIPIFTAQRYEVAKSHDKMKYRAVAGQFFAHQRGGNVGFKVVLYLIGPSTLDYLTYIQALHLYGQGSYDKINSLKSGASIVNAKSIGNSIKTKMFKGGDNSWMQVEKHFTFPILTKEEILHDMYIETVLYERDITFGDALKVTLLCRKYIRPETITSISLLDKSGIATTITDIEYKTALDSGVWPSKVKNISVDYSVRSTKWTNVIGLLEQYMHRQYITRIGDPYTDIEITRSIGGRIDGSVYALNGKLSRAKVKETLTVNFGEMLDDYSDFFDTVGYKRKQEKLGHVNSRLIGVTFYDVSTNNPIKIMNSSKAKYLRTIEKGTEYNISAVFGLVRYYASVQNTNSGILKLSKLQRRGATTYLNSTTTHTFLTPADNQSRFVLIYANGDGTYDVYSYDSEVQDADYSHEGVIQ